MWCRPSRREPLMLVSIKIHGFKRRHLGWCRRRRCCIMPTSGLWLHLQVFWEIGRCGRWRHCILLRRWQFPWWFTWGWGSLCGSTWWRCWWFGWWRWRGSCTAMLWVLRGSRWRCNQRGQDTAAGGHRRQVWCWQHRYLPKKPGRPLQLRTLMVPWKGNEWRRPQQWTLPKWSKGVSKLRCLPRRWIIASLYKAGRRCKVA